jgi:hypothetical protein
VHYDSPGSLIEGNRFEGNRLERERTAPQKHTDHALDEAAAAVNEALKHVVAAVEWLSTLTQVKNREAPHYVNLLREEIAEVRRVRQ